MPERLSATDRASLNSERGPVNMAVAGVIVLEPGAGVGYDAICRRIEERVHLLPRYRQRLAQPALGVATPVWVDDEHFDVHWHVRQTSLSAPGDDAQLAAYVAKEAARLMDRTRPLWELHLIEGLSDGRVVVMPKMHHALVDGMAALGIGMILFDATPAPAPVEPPTEPWQPRPYALRRHLTQLARLPVTRTVGLAMDSAERLLEATPRSATADLRRATALVSELAVSRPRAPKLPLNRPISANRSYALTQTPLADVKAAAKTSGGTVNDVILAAVTGMLAHWLVAASVDPASLPRDPVALVPVSIRGKGEEQTTGNRISIVFVDLPVGEPDPQRRVKLLNERMTAIKGSAKVAAGSVMVDLGGAVPPLLSSIMARVPGADGGAFNLVVSNVPGPQFPMYLNGSRVVAVHPAVPLNPADQGLNVGVFSYDGRVCFGLMADRNLTPDVSVALAGLEAALAELTS